MKKILVYLLWTAVVAAAGCSTDDLTGRVEDLEDRVTALEALCDRLNTDLKSLSTIVKAVEEYDYITGVTPVLQDNEVIGYTITFAKNDPITIYHGKGGEMAVIGVKKNTDGLYYWTIDGDWLLDSSGNKLPVEGGGAGDATVVPQLKIENGEWYVSYDGGATWSSLNRKATAGESASLFSEVNVENPDYVVFKLAADGTEIKLPRFSSLQITFDTTEDPIEVAPKSSIRIGYEITGNLSEVQIETASSGDIKAKVLPESPTTGYIEVVAGDDIDDEGFTRILVVVLDGATTVMKSLVFALGIPEDMEEAFPDAAFRDYLLSEFDTDSDGKLSKEEAKLVEQIFIDGKELTPNKYGEVFLEGLRYFTNLTDLSCTNCKITHLDVSKNVHLKTLVCDKNELTGLDISQNTELEELDCQENKLESLDVSNNPILSILKCGANQLTELDISRNKELEELDCHNNELTDLDVSKLTKLESLSCNNNDLTQLDVSNNTALTDLGCWNNELSGLDVTHNANLTDLFCSDNALTALDVSKNTALITLDCSNNQLTELDLSKNAALDDLVCSANQLTELDVSKTDLGNGRMEFPLDCSSMSTLKTLTLKTGWKINKITEDRDVNYIPSGTKIEYVD